MKHKFKFFLMLVLCLFIVFGLSFGLYHEFTTKNTSAPTQQQSQAPKTNHSNKKADKALKKKHEAETNQQKKIDQDALHKDKSNVKHHKLKPVHIAKSNKSKLNHKLLTADFHADKSFAQSIYIPKHNQNNLTLILNKNGKRVFNNHSAHEKKNQHNINMKVYNQAQQLRKTDKNLHIRIAK